MFGGMPFPSGDLASMQQQLMQNPDMVRNIMQSPMMESMLSNPDLLRGMLMSNPQVRELTERNPELGHMLSDPEMLRQAMQAARNPALMQEMMRHSDRAMSQLENLPGGFAALQRVHETMSEPMLRALEGGFTPPTASSSAGSSTATPATSVTRDPVPNPWAGE